MPKKIKKILKWLSVMTKMIKTTSRCSNFIFILKISCILLYNIIIIIIIFLSKFNYGQIIMWLH
jgi:hypothetical protein